MKGLHGETNRCAARILGAVTSVLALVAASLPCLADSADFSLPASVSFVITDVASPTIGNPDPTAISFSNASLTVGYSVRISIRAMDSNFTRPGDTGTYIQASDVTWATTGEVGGFGYAGTLTAAGYTRVFQGHPNTTSGSAQVTWTLNALDAGICAGEHMLTAVWKVESL